MRSEAKLISKNVVQVRLTPETVHERKLLDDKTDTDVIEIYYRKAVGGILPDYVVHETIDQSEWPYAAKVRVERVVGLSNY